MRRPGGFDDGRPADDASREREQPATRASRVDRLVGVEPEATVTSEPVAPESRVARIARRASGNTPASPEAEARAAQLAADREADRAVLRAKQELKQAERQRRGRERREQRRFTAHSRVRRRRFLIGFAAVLGLAMFVAAGVFTPIMAVREIQVEGTQTIRPEDVRTALASFEGMPLALVNDSDVHRALEQFPLIQRYAVERIPPHTLLVRLEERTPVIALQREDGFAVYDPAGVLLSKDAERPAGVPAGSPELSDTTSPAFLAAAAIVRDLPDDIRQQLVSVRATNAQDVEFGLASGTEVLWGEAKETQRKAIVLRAMLAAVGTPSLIDVSAPDAPVFK